MSAALPVLRVGLTGGIASGKTTVASFFADCGAFVLDADRIAHGVILPGGSAYDDVVSRFGLGILEPSGKISRPRLAGIVFADESARADLEAIVHPRVREEAVRRLEEHMKTAETRVAIFDAALLVETGAYRDHHRLVVLRCSPETQFRRLIERGRFAEHEARARIGAQAPLESKLAVADYVIDTETGLEQTRTRTGQVYGELLQDQERQFGGATTG